jgi:hypothetical protein
VGRVQRDRATGQIALDDQASPRSPFGPAGNRCTTPVRRMVAVGASAVKEARRHHRIPTPHPLDCPVRDKGGECPLQTPMRYGRAAAVI